MVKRTQSIILFVLGLLAGILIYWLTSISFFSGTEGFVNSSRIIASSSGGDGLKNCDQINTITNKDNIDIYCSFVTEKKDKGVGYKVRSTVVIKTDQKSKKAVVSVKKKLKDTSKHITEADYCGDECVTPIIVDIGDTKDLAEVSQVLRNQVSNALNREDDLIEEAVEDAYDVYKKKQEIKRRIANCEISPESTIEDIIKISPTEKMGCRKDQLADIKKAEDRTDFFHSTVKKDLWYLVQQDEPLDQSFFRSEPMREMDSRDFFDYDYFSVHSAIDTAQKYNDLRLFMHELGDNKLAALNTISMQMPFYFYTHDTMTGRQDRIMLERAWNRNFTERPFPSYYSLTLKPRKANKTPPANRRGGLSAQQFRAIVNSPGFQKLYRQ